jgi:SAM-dependent methyltransferase
MSINFIPWWGKIATKIMLSRLPLGYEFWKKFGLFELGAMEQPEYAYKVFKRLFDRAKPNPGFVSLELGPGDSLFSALVAKAFGGSASYLVDNGDYALKDIQLYKNMADYLVQEGLLAPDIQKLNSIEEVLACCHAHYLTSGLSSLRTIPDQSVDFIWSHAVLEHVRPGDFLDIQTELRRIIHPNGICSHQVDLKDHLSNALNNLRFSERIWESDFMARSGFYTNRIRYSKMLHLFQKAGFDVEVIEVNRWKELPTPRARLSQEFTQFSDEELCISDFSVLLKPA